MKPRLRFEISGPGEISAVDNATPPARLVELSLTAGPVRFRTTVKDWRFFAVRGGAQGCIKLRAFEP